MPTKKHIKPGEKLPLKLTAAERKLLLEGLACLELEIEQIIRDTPASQPVMLSLDDLDDLGGHVAAEANHCDDQRKAKKLDATLQKILVLLEQFTDDEPPQSIKIADAKKEKLLSDQAVQIAEFVGQALVAAEQLGIKEKPLPHFRLSPAQRDTLQLVPGMTKALKKKLATDETTYTIAEVASMALALAKDLPAGDARRQVAELLVAEHLANCLKDGILNSAQPTTKKKAKSTTKHVSDELYQFKITLLGAKPPIWRRIQVKDCKLDKLHEHIQTAMGWTNSHLHQFEIKGQIYGDPELLDDGFEDFECVDSTKTNLSQILPKTGRRFAFKYEYDFGDGWEHEVLFEGSPPVDPKAKYPLCLEGQRACPPEDCGGVGGYWDFLKAISNPKHDEHESMLEWIGGSFDPEKFDAKKATKAMKKGLPDWRTM